MQSVMQVKLRLFFLQFTRFMNPAGLPEAKCEYTDPRNELCGNGAAATVMVNFLIMAALSLATLVALL